MIFWHDFLQFIIEEEGAYRRRRLKLFYPDLAKLSCYLETEVDNVEDEEKILLAAIDDPVLELIVVSILKLI